MMPYAPEYDELLAQVFPNMGKYCRIRTPVTAVRTDDVIMGDRVLIMPGCRMMSAGSITIDDDVMIAANVHLISNKNGDSPRGGCFRNCFYPIR